jgi:hypothetical protein
MSNTSQNSSITLIQVAKHTRAHIMLWQSTHGRSARPKPLQEPPARANPVVRYPSAAGFFYAECQTKGGRPSARTVERNPSGGDSGSPPPILLGLALHGRRPAAFFILSQPGR